jgi:hypothetical protein
MTPPENDAPAGRSDDPSFDPLGPGAGSESLDRPEGRSAGRSQGDASQEIQLWGSERPQAKGTEAPPTFRRPDSRKPSESNGNGHHRHSTRHRKPSSYRRRRRHRSHRSRERRPRASLFRRWQRAWHEHPWRTRGGLVAGVLLVVGLALVADAYYQAYHVYGDIKQAIPQFQQAKATLVHGKLPPQSKIDALTAFASEAQLQVEDARFSYRLVGAVPLLGAPVKAATWAAAAANQDAQAVGDLQSLVGQVLGAQAAKTGNLSDASIPLYHDGRIDVARIEHLTPGLQTLLTHLEAGAADLRRIPSIPFTSRLTTMKQSALQDSNQAISLVSRGLTGAKLLPGFFGAHSPRTYFIALQNSVDQRATGGAVLAYAIIQIDHGQVRLLRGGPISDLDIHSGVPDFRPPPAVDWYARATGAKLLINNSANYGPDFPVVASTWAAMVHRITGLHIDGAMAFDPRAIQAMLQGQGQLRIPAYPVRVSAGNVVSLVSRDQFALSRAQQRELPGQLVAAAFKVLEHPKNPLKLAAGLEGTIPGRHVQVWEADPQDESLIKSLGWSGALTATSGDSLDLAYDKRIAGKQDYWTRELINYDVTVQATGTLDSSYTVKMSDDIPQQGQGGRMIPHVTPWGLNVAMLNLYVPRRAEFKSVTPNYKAFPTNFISPLRYVHYVQPRGFVQHYEGTHKVFTQTVTPYPGHPATVRFRYQVPNGILSTADGKVYELSVDAQPLYRAATMTVTVHLPPGSRVKSAPPGWTVKGSTLQMSPVTLDKGFTAKIVF